jgi:hypothetical protein
MDNLESGHMVSLRFFFSFTIFYFVLLSRRKHNYYIISLYSQGTGFNNIMSGLHTNTRVLRVQGNLLFAIK